MGKLGKVFGVLVLVLSLAVAALSFMLANQRKMFRGHSEALANGLMKVANEIRSEEGVDVSDKLSGVSYSAAVAGGKESGTLGFENYRTDSQSVDNAVASMVDALKARQAQSDALATTVAKVAGCVGVSKEAGVNKESLLTDGEYSKKLDSVLAQAKASLDRDEIIRGKLEALGGAMGVHTVELSRPRFYQCAKNENSYAIAGTMDEFSQAYTMLFAQQRAFMDIIGKFQGTVNRYQNWGFEINAVASAARRFQEVDKTSAAERKNFMDDFQSKLNTFVSDAEGLNTFITETLKEMESAKSQSAEHKATADRIETEKNELNAKFVALQEKFEKQSSDMASLQTRMQGLLGTCAKIETEDPLAGEVITSLKDIDEASFSCIVLRVDAKFNSVILSANNRKLCPGAQLLVISSKKNNEVIRLQVKEATDRASKAYVLTGNADVISVGDRVELSGDHARLVREAEKADAEN